MQAFILLLVALVAAMTVDAAPALRGTVTTTYSLCSTEETTLFVESVTAASDSCGLQSAYDWHSGSLPTDSQRKDLCGCTRLTDHLQDVAVPRCLVVIDNLPLSYDELIQYAFELCTGSSSGTTALSVVNGSNTSNTDGSSSHSHSPKTVGDLDEVASKDVSFSEGSDEETTAIGSSAGGVLLLAIVLWFCGCRGAACNLGCGGDC